MLLLWCPLHSFQLQKAWWNQKRWSQIYKPALYIKFPFGSGKFINLRVLIPPLFRPNKEAELEQLKKLVVEFKKTPPIWLSHLYANLIDALVLLINTSSKWSSNNRREKGEEFELITSRFCTVVKWDEAWVAIKVYSLQPLLSTTHTLLKGSYAIKETYEHSRPNQPFVGSSQK